LNLFIFFLISKYRFAEAVHIFQNLPQELRPTQEEELEVIIKNLNNHQNLNNNK